MLQFTRSLFVYCIANFDLGLYYDSISLRTNPDGMAQEVEDVIGL